MLTFSLAPISYVYPILPDLTLKVKRGETTSGVICDLQLRRTPVPYQAISVDGDRPSNLETLHRRPLAPAFLKGQHGDQKEKLEGQQATVDDRPMVDQIHSELLVANPVVNSVDSYAFSGNVDHKQERQEATCSVDDQLVPKVEEMDRRHECQNSRPHFDVVVHYLQMRCKNHTKDLLPVEHTSKPYSIESDAIGAGDYPESESGKMVACSAGASFTPHVITVASGEDVTMKIILFAQQGPQDICILSANGIVSNVTLRQPESSGGTLTYEGRFELLSLSGSFMPTETGGTKSRSGGMSVALASADGRVVGRGVSGLLVDAGPMQVVVGSFMPGYQMEHNTNRNWISGGQHLQFQSRVLGSTRVMVVYQTQSRDLQPPRSFTGTTGLCQARGPWSTRFLRPGIHPRRKREVVTSGSESRSTKRLKKDSEFGKVHSKEGFSSETHKKPAKGKKLGVGGADVPL